MAWIFRVVSTEAEASGASERDQIFRQTEEVCKAVLWLVPHRHHPEKEMGRLGFSGGTWSPKQILILALGFKGSSWQGPTEAIFQKL